MLRRVALVLTRATRRNTPQDAILHSHRHENLNSFNILISNKTISVAFSPQANYTDCVTATGRRILVPTFTDRGVSGGQRGVSPTVVNLSFLDRSCYFSFKWLLIKPHEAEWTLFQTYC
jgi:hypothetical protein